MIPTPGPELAVPATAAAGVMTVALPSRAGATNYATGFVITGGGATGASVIVATLTGLIGGTQSYDIPVPAGATLGIFPLVVDFPRPIPATDSGVAVTLNVPSFGAGNTNAAAVLFGFAA